MDNLMKIAQEFHANEIGSFFVGGFVRDELLGMTSEDVDICLVGATKDDVMRILSQFDFVLSVAQEVGNSFPVWIADIEGIGKVDFALARGEKKTGPSRQDFECTTDGVSIVDDLLRRDLTINAIAKDVLTGQIVDPFNGAQHLRDGIAHPVSEAFAEDTLRVLRAARFIARFNLTPSQELIDMCKGLEPTDISPERVGMELVKAMKQAVKPSAFFLFLKEVDWLKHFFQELQALVGVQQSAIHHPEGDAFTHTMLCVDQATDMFTRIVMVCHDLGKAVTTVVKDSKVTAHGHEVAGVPLALAMMQRVVLLDTAFQKRVALMVELHMIHTLTISEKVIRRTLRQLMKVGLTFDQLTEVCRCDVSGRAPLPAFTPNIGQQRAAELLEQGLMTPVVTGKLLVSMGVKPGQFMGNFINKALELQDRGTLNESNWVQVMKGSGFCLSQ